MKLAIPMGVCIAWRALGELDQRGRLVWEECFADATFIPAKKGGRIGKTKRGKGTKLVAVADGEGVPLGLRVESASPPRVHAHRSDARRRERAAP